MKSDAEGGILGRHFCRQLERLDLVSAAFACGTSPIPTSDPLSNWPSV